MSSLFIWLIFAGIVSVSLNIQKGAAIAQLEGENIRPRISWREQGIIGILAIGSGLIIYWKLSVIGWLGVAIAILSSLLVLLMSVLIIADNDYVQKN